MRGWLVQRSGSSSSSVNRQGVGAGVGVIRGNNEKEAGANWKVGILLASSSLSEFDSSLSSPRAAKEFWAWIGVEGGGGGGCWALCSHQASW